MNMASTLRCKGSYGPREGHEFVLLHRCCINNGSHVHGFCDTYTPVIFSEKCAKHVYKL